MRAGRGDANGGGETSAPVKDRVGETRVCVGSFRATYLAWRSQPRECVAFERGLAGSGLVREGYERVKFGNDGLIEMVIRSKGGMFLG